MTALEQHVTPDDVIAALDLLRGEFRTRAQWCDTCQRKHIRSELPGPFVDVHPGAIPADDQPAHERVLNLISQAPAHRFGDGRVRIPLSDLGRAITTAALLRSLGTPAHAIHLGGY